MNVHLTPEQEQLVQEELESGRFDSVEEVIDQALDILRLVGSRSAASIAAGAGNRSSQQEAVEEMLRWVEQNRVPLTGPRRELTHEEIVEAFQELRKGVQPDSMSIKDMINEGRRF